MTQSYVKESSSLSLILAFFFSPGKHPYSSEGTTLEMALVVSPGGALWAVYFLCSLTQ